MKIILSGGGTLGSVIPLLAIADHVRSTHKEAEFVWVGTKTGPEKEIIQKEGMRYLHLESGKLRRYASLLNILDLFRCIIGFGQACMLIWRENPDLCISAGGFVSVPLHFAAWWFGIPTWIHQQDIQIGLSNRLMAPSARVITTATEENAKKFSGRKTRWLGNPVRPDFLTGSREDAKKIFQLQTDLPVILATGGGTGSLRVNQIVVETIHHLEGMAEIIHLTGRDRPQELIRRAEERFPYYHPYQFLTEEMKHAYAAADVIVARAGFATLAEVAALGKPLILIPKPGHQEVNAKYFVERGAALILDERTATGAHLAPLIKQLLIPSGMRQQMSAKIRQILPVAKREDIVQTLHRIQ